MRERGVSYRGQATNPHPFPSPHRGGLGGPQSEFLQQIPGAEALLHHHKVRFTEVASHAEQGEPRGWMKLLPWSTAGCLGHRLRKYATHCGEREMEEETGTELVSSEVSNRILSCPWAHGLPFKWVWVCLSVLYYDFFFFKIGIHVVQADLKLTM